MDVELSKEKQNSLVADILRHVKNGELEEGYMLPGERGKDVVWMPGGQDGTFCYHYGREELSEREHAVMAGALRAAFAGTERMAQAEARFRELLEKRFAAELIDPIQEYLRCHRTEFVPEQLLLYAAKLLMTAAEPEFVKIALSLLEDLPQDPVPELRNVIPTVGQCEEFTLFALFVMRKWENGMDACLALAKKVHGWGRIFAVRELEPETEEIRRWLLTEGMKNTVGLGYASLACWRKSGARDVLMGEPTQEEFTGIGRILEQLLEEDAVWGFSSLEDGDEVIDRYLEVAGERELTMEDYCLLVSIRDLFGGEGRDDPAVVSRCDDLLDTEDCAGTALAAVREGKAWLAAKLGLDYKAEYLAALKADFRKNRGNYLTALLRDPDYREETLDLLRKNLPLAEITVARGKKKLKMNENLELSQPIEELRNGPPGHPDFIEAGLWSGDGRARWQTLLTLEAWVEAAGIPLADLFPEIVPALTEMGGTLTGEDDEPERRAVAQLLAGDVSFRDPDDSDDDDDWDEDEDSDEEGWDEDEDDEGEDADDPLENADLCRVARETVRKDSDEVFGGFGFRHLSYAVQSSAANGDGSPRETEIYQPVGEALTLGCEFLRALRGGDGAGDFRMSEDRKRSFLTIRVPGPFRENGVVPPEVALYRVSAEERTLRVGAYGEDGELLERREKNFARRYALLPALTAILCRVVLESRWFGIDFGDFAAAPSADDFISVHASFARFLREDWLTVSYGEVYPADCLDLPSRRAELARLPKEKRPVTGEIRAGWEKREPGWTLRYNQLVDAINAGASPDGVVPPLTPEERKWYDQSAARLKRDNEQIAEDCRVAGVPPWRTTLSKHGPEFE